ncbi:DNA ligase D [Ottowia thiooxydans]|uniref:DNA ligase D n=1 Tax=Ottowia thiooxydans TaxID=219182 RepID=UPI00048D1DB5|nr:DNA ligase D [Ottowia thiooxydans]
MATKRPPRATAKRAPASAPEVAGASNTRSRKQQPQALQDYRARRNFSLTPEPSGGVSEAGELAGLNRFVIQKHWASKLHYDFRLEIGGTMKSWAVPKGPSLDPQDKRLAVQVEDHPVEYNQFEGQIPTDQYGGGRVIIWDRGTWSPLSGHDPAHGLAAGNFKFKLTGVKLNGNWALIRLKGEDDTAKTNWLLIKEKDDEARPAAEFSVTHALPDSVGPAPALAPAKAKRLKSVAIPPEREVGGLHALKAPQPETMAPQLASLAQAPPADSLEWLWELKFDGYRLLARMAAGRVKLYTRNGIDWTSRMPEIAAALASVPVKTAWFDGEVVVLNEQGVPDFAALQTAFDGRQAKNLVLYLFDLLYLNGADLRQIPQEQRRTCLTKLMEEAPMSPVLRVTQSFETDPGSLLDSATRIGMEGVIGKRRKAAYLSGRSNDWIKLKTRQSDEFLIAGFTDGRGARAAQGDIGALVLAAYDEIGSLRYAGNVGSGFDSVTLATLKKRLSPLLTTHKPMSKEDLVAGAVHWVRPQLVVQIAHAGMTPQGRLRQPVYMGLREDKAREDILLPGLSSAGHPMNEKKPVGSKAKTSSKAKEKPEPALASTAPGVLLGQTLTHPERVVDPSTGVTKLDLARYYASVAPLLLPHLAQRPVALLRAPGGIDEDAFFQKHMEGRQLPGVTVLDTQLDPGHAGLLEINNAAALLGSVQMNTVELHTWNATSDKIERPDRFTLDLDPGEGVAWLAVQEAAQLAYTLLTELKLVPFLKTSGGKGLHVVVPIKRLHGWTEVKAFSKLLTEHLARLLPDRFVAISGPKNRVGKIYVDYLRNGRGATTVSAWSLRARPGMGISVPVGWEELPNVESGAHWNITNIQARLRLGNQPWHAYAASSRSIGAAARQLNAAIPNNE